MRVYLLLFFVFAFAANSFAQEIKFQYDLKENDFGFVSRRSYMSQEFKFTNTGDAPLEIKKLSASCDCLMATCSSYTIKPGESGLITLIFFAEELGSFAHTLTLLTNAKSSPTVYLRVSGLVR